MYTIDEIKEAYKRIPTFNDAKFITDNGIEYIELEFALDNSKKRILRHTLIQYDISFKDAYKYVIDNVERSIDEKSKGST
jgi:hypothetical protein